MLRTMELLLGLSPMSQYDAAATPMYASFGTEPDATPFTLVPAQVSLDERNTEKSVGAQLSKKMDFSDLDLAPMHLLNEILWKSVKGADSTMPPPVHRYRPVSGVDLYPFSPFAQRLRFLAIKCRELVFFRSSTCVFLGSFSKTIR